MLHVDWQQQIFEWIHQDSVVATACFCADGPNDLFHHPYVGLFQVQTALPFRRQGLMTFLLHAIDKCVKTEMNVRFILLNVQAQNTIALDMYQKMGFSVLRSFNDEGLCFVMIKDLDRLDDSRDAAV